MADWGDIAGGISKGIGEGVRTVADLQKINLMNTQNDIEKNKFDVWKKEQEENEKPVYLDRIKSGLDPEVYKTLYDRALPAGLVSKDSMGNEYIKTKHGKDFMSSLNTDSAMKHDLAVARLTASQRKEGELKTALEKANDKEQPTLMEQLKKQQSESDSLRYGIDTFVKKNEAQLKEREISAHETTAQAALIKSLQKESKWTHSGTTEKGGLPVWENPETKQMIVRTQALDENGKPTFKEVPFDSKIHGRLLGKTLSQTTIINQGQQREGEFNSWAPEEKQMSYQRKLLGETVNFGFGQAAVRNRMQFERGYNQWLQGRGTSAGEATAIKADVKTLTAAKSQNEKRINLSAGFVNQIEQNSALLKQMREKYGTNYGKLANAAVNAWKSGVPGSGDVEALRLALISTSNEIAKVESGSLGIAEVSVEQARNMKKIHNINLNADDLEKVLNTGVQLGRLRMKSLNMEKSRIDWEMKNLGNPGRTQGNRPPLSSFSQ